MNQDMIEQVIHDIKTPAYVFDLDLLTARLTMIKELLGPQVLLCYAMKANPFLLSAMNPLVERFEVCSPGEFSICEQQGIPMDRIVLSGVNKDPLEIRRVVRTYDGHGIFTIESLEHLGILAHASKEYDKQLKILLRLTSGNQFGMDQRVITHIIKNRQQYPGLIIQGLQLYSGTQKKKLSKVGQELESLDAYCTWLKEECDFEVKELEYGPGFYVPYFQNESPADDRQLLKEFGLIIKKMQFQGSLTLEMGRYMVYNCGYYLTTIVDCKRNLGQNYCIIDGGIHHVNYYGQTMAMKFPIITKLRPKEHSYGDDNFMDTDYYNEMVSDAAWNICGSLCTQGDVLIRNYPLFDVQIGDYLVLERLGAYSVTEGIYLFLSRDLPQILFYSKKDGLVLVRDALPTYPMNTGTITL